MRLAKLAAIATWGLLAAFLGGAPALAQADYPSRLITLIVPFAAGGPTDLVARIIADNMSRTLGQQIIIENVIGGGGTTAATRAKRAPPDGYTIIMGHMGTHAAAVALYPKLAYDPVTDFAPVGMVAGMPVIILAKRSIPANDLREFIAFAKSYSGTLTMAHAGVGSVSHVTCLLLNSIIGAKPRMVAFQGTGPAMNALVAGKVDYMCDQIVSVVPRARDGSIRTYAISTPERSPALPDTPTAREGGLPEFQASAWNALFAPRGTPPAIIDKLNAALSKALDDATVRKDLRDLGGEIPAPEARSPAALADLVKREVARWTPIIRRMNSAD